MKTKKFNWLHVAISWGASIVILGAMFKINHWGGHMGTYMIGLGLAVEAMLFFTLGFFPPAQDPAWEKVYPQLADDFQGEVSYAGANAFKSNALSSSLDKVLSQGGLDEEKISRLGEGLQRFTDKLSRINTIADASIGADEFSDKLKSASSKFDMLGLAFEKASAGFTAIANSGEDAKAYQHQVAQLTQNLLHLNALYELELHGADGNLRKINSFYTGLSGTLQSLSDSAAESRDFKEEINRLTKNMSSLNVYYANMLSAMTQPRFQ